MTLPQQPQTERGRRTRERIVDAAAGVIAERGAEGASLDQVLACAGASKSQLYHYFADKNELVRAVITRCLDQMLGQQQVWLSTLDSWAAIRRWFDALAAENEAQGYPGCPIGTLASELAHRDEPTRETLADCFERWQRFLVEGFERMRSRGELVRTADPERLATAVLASLQGGLLMSKTNKDPEPLRLALDAAYTYLRSFRSARSTRRDRSPDDI